MISGWQKRTLLDLPAPSVVLVAVALVLCCTVCSAFSVPVDNNNSNSNNPSIAQVGTTKNVATQILQGAGPCTAEHMNQYNIEDDSLHRVRDEWTANLVQKAAEKETTLSLGCKSSDLFVDKVTVTFPRQNDSALGLNLLELAGGREDGLGITVITDIDENGAAANADIVPGDSISSISIIRTRAVPNKKLEETQEVFTVQTECLDYEATVNAIVNDLPTPQPNDVWQITLKRLRRKPVVTVNLQYPPSQNEPDVSLQLFAGENLRQGMLVRGVKLNDELARRFDTKSSGNCGAGGLCRTCSVVVVRGGELLNPQRVAEKQMLADSPRWRLACKAIVGYGMKEGEMTIRVNPNQW